MFHVAYVVENDKKISVLYINQIVITENSMQKKHPVTCVCPALKLYFIIMLFFYIKITEFNFLKIIRLMLTTLQTVIKNFALK